MLNKLSRKDIALLNILAKTPESKSALDEYIEQHEKAVKAYKVYRESVVAEVEVDKVVKPVETKRKFKAGDKVRVLSTENALATSGLRIGDVTEVLKYSLGYSVVVLKSPHQTGYAYFDESALELVEGKTPNELRAEIIEKAKSFIGSTIERGKDIDALEIDDGHEYYRNRLFNVDFHTKNNNVTALFYSSDYTGRRFCRKPDLIGRANCHPDDVFNADIGKAIALGRALGKDVSEFENAVQPTVAIGQEIEVLNKWTKQRIGAFLMVDGFCKYGYPTHDNGTHTSDYKITDDTNAIYKEATD